MRLPAGVGGVNRPLGAFPDRYQLWRLASQLRPDDAAHADGPAEHQQEAASRVVVRPGSKTDGSYHGPTQSRIVVVLRVGRIGQRGQQQHLPGGAADALRRARPRPLRADTDNARPGRRRERPPPRVRAPTSRRSRRGNRTGCPCRPPRPAGCPARRGPPARRAGRVRRTARRRSRTSAGDSPASPWRAGPPGAAGRGCSRRGPAPAARSTAGTPVRDTFSWKI